MGRKLIKYPLYTFVYSLFAFFIILPIIYTLGMAFFVETSWNTILHAFDLRLFLLLAKSLLIAAIIAFCSSLFGTALAFLVYKTNIKFRNLFKILLLLPLFISPYILAVAWKDFIFIFFGNSSFIYSYVGVIIVLTSIYTPLSMLIIGSALANINAQLEETALVMTSTRKVILKITLPLIKPALITSFVLVFIFSISEFSVPAFFGVKVFTTEIFTQFSAFYNHSLAILQSSLLILICILLLFSERKHIADAPFLSVGSSGTRSHFYTLKKKSLALAFLLIWFSISVLFPYVLLFIQSFKNGTDKFVQAYQLLSTSFISSISLAFLAALLIVFVGFVAAYFSTRSKETKKRKSFNWLLLIVFAIPSTILGISFIKFYNRPILDFIYSSYLIILIAFVGKFSFIAAKLIANAILQIPDSLDEAAQIQGIPLSIRIQKILVPLIMPSLFVAFIISFIFCLGELGLSIMLYPPGTEMMPIKVFTIMANAPQSLTSSMTLIVFSITLLLISSFYFFLKTFYKNHDFVND